MSALELEQRNLSTEGADTPSEVASTARIDGVITGTLVGLACDSRTALVTYAGQPDTAAIRASTVIDLHGRHIGRRVVLMFERGDPRCPVVMGRLRGDVEYPPDLRHASVDVEADGERMVVAAKEQLVLKCGKASITLTRAGKILISGSYVLTHSTGTNRLKGGSIQLN